MSALGSDSVRRVQKALADAGSPAQVIELAETARSATDAAASIGVALGSIVKSLVFVVGGHPVMALVSGDRKCREDQLPRVFQVDGKVKRAKAETVRSATGFAIGGVAPVGLPAGLPVVIDVGLKRFDTVYAAAGHPHCVFATSVDELARLTGGLVSDVVAE